jgi:hypothetical protein
LYSSNFPSLSLVSCLQKHFSTHQDVSLLYLVRFFRVNDVKMILMMLVMIAVMAPLGGDVSYSSRSFVTMCPQYQNSFSSPNDLVEARKIEQKPSPQCLLQSKQCNMLELIFGHCRILWCRTTFYLCGDKHRNSRDKHKCFDAESVMYYLFTTWWFLNIQ